MAFRPHQALFQAAWRLQAAQAAWRLQAAQAAQAAGLPAVERWVAPRVRAPRPVAFQRARLARHRSLPLAWAGLPLATPARALLRPLPALEPWRVR